jgi:SM-20-related protein
MAQSYPPFAMLDEEAIRAAELRHDPYDFAFVDQVMSQSLKEKVLADAPEIPWRGSYAMRQLDYGPAFATVLKELYSDRMRRLVGEKLEMDLSDCPPSIVMMGNTTGAYNEGYAHPDSSHKKATVIVGFSHEWPYQRGQFRVLRSDDREDCAFEFPPLFGKMLMFRVCDHSWHGFLPQKGKRMSLQLCYVDSDWYAWREEWRHGVSAAAKSNAITRQVLQWAPRRLF